MANITLYKQLLQISGLKKKDLMIAALRQLHPSAQHFLVYALDSQIEWLLPEGMDVPFKKQSNANDQEGRLLAEVRRLYVFLKGGNPNLKQVRREHLFVQLLETVHPDDAELLLYAKDKKLPFKNITEELIREAYPQYFFFTSPQYFEGKNV